MKGRSQDQKKEDGLTAALMICVCVGVMIFFIWIMRSVSIVTFWTPKLYALGRMWLWLPGTYGVARTQELFTAGSAFLASPDKVSFFDWVSYVNSATLPFTVAAFAALSAWLGRAVMKPTAQVRRKFTPQRLAEHLSHVFTGIAPVLHLREKIAKGAEPFWKRPLFPSEALLGGKVYGKPLLSDGEPVPERVRDYFMGLERVKTQEGLVLKLVQGRRVSSTLGIQVVDLLTDRGKKGVPFTDRFSPTGKVIYALLCAHAFGGNEGKADYAKARDQLNNSARGAKHGFANLSVARWLFDKYRGNPQARKLFAVHHWEHTYLWALLIMAKRQGKCGHWEFMWLQPMNRSLFYAMNTVGRLTPHTESAAAFAQYIYERRTAVRKRLPLQLGKSGAYEQVIYVEKAVKGLLLEWERWKEGEDEDDEWWMSSDPWRMLNGINLPPPQAPPESMQGDTAFDRTMRTKAKEEEEERSQASRSAEVALQSAAEW